jgi:Flp pilus assembly protein TadG
MTRRPTHILAHLRRFARARRGATAIEFSIIALPFCALMFGAIELGLVFMASTTLEFATDAAARKIRTGQFQTSGATTKGNFKTAVCNNMSWLSVPCGSKLTVDVQTFANFTGAAGNNPANPTLFNPNATCFTTGQPGDIVLVRTYYEWDLYTPLLNVGLQNMGATSNKRLISSATSFRNEPYSTQSPVGAKCN